MVASTSQSRRQYRTSKRRQYISNRKHLLFGFEHDEDVSNQGKKGGGAPGAHRAPFILPDSYLKRRDAKIKHLPLTPKSYLSAKAKCSSTFGRRKRCYLPGHLYRMTDHSSVFTVDCSSLSGDGTLISVSTLGADGLIGDPEHKKKNQYQIRASRLEDEGLLSDIVSLGTAFNKRKPNGNARILGLNLGCMHVFGDRMFQGEWVTYKSMAEKAGEDLRSLELLGEIKKLALRTSLGLASWMRDKSHSCWRCLLERLRKAERDAGVSPSSSLGGRHGVTSSGVISTDLGNESHFDVLDDGESVSVWAEVIPGTAKNWYLCFPNMEICTQGKVYYGLRIKLCHGAIVNWDGRVMKHCTSVTDVGKGNHVYGYFFCPSTRLHHS